jgi:hypothetical protein
MLNTAQWPLTERWLPEPQRSQDLGGGSRKCGRDFEDVIQNPQQCSQGQCRECRCRLHDGICRWICMFVQGMGGVRPIALGGSQYSQWQQQHVQQNGEQDC